MEMEYQGDIVYGICEVYDNGSYTDPIITGNSVEELGTVIEMMKKAIKEPVFYDLS